VTRQRGMTLIEALVALALLSLLSAGLISTFQLGQRTYRQIVRFDRSNADIAITHRFVRRVLESAYPFEPEQEARDRAGLQGTADTLEVTAPASLADGGTGNRRYELRVESKGVSKNLVVSSHLDRNGLPSSADGTAPAEVLLANIESVEWAYAERPSEWLSEWVSRWRPPTLVRLRVRFPDGDPRHWPDLLITPRITDDSNCQFDVVSQNCREPAT
jgi:general secretion pathway protein J